MTSGFIPLVRQTTHDEEDEHYDELGNRDEAYALRTQPARVARINWLSIGMTAAAVIIIVAVTVGSVLR
jgi:hypothetical protein